VLAQAIRAGGTTLRDYLGADGAPGYFRQRCMCTNAGQALPRAAARRCAR